MFGALGQPGAPAPHFYRQGPANPSFLSTGTPHFYRQALGQPGPPTPHFYRRALGQPGPPKSLTFVDRARPAQPLTSIDPYSLLILIYTSASAPQHGLPTEPGPPPGGADSMHRRSDSEPEAMLGAYAGPGWRSLGYLGAMLAPSWLQLGHLGGLLGHLRARRLPLGF